MSSPVPVGWCVPVPHPSGASDTSWVERCGIHYASLPNLKVAPLDIWETHNSEGLDMGQCNMVLTFPWYQTSIRLSMETPKGIRDRQPQISSGDVSCRCSYFDGIRQSICLHKFASPSLLPLSQCWDQIWLSLQTQTNSREYGRNIHKVPQTVKFWCFPHSCCCRRTLLVVDVDPTSDHQSKHK
jgi:hypothetical protein